MILLLSLKLLLSHFLGDFIFQPASWVKDKDEKKYASKYLYLHIGVHILLLAIATQFSLNYWLGILCIGISHLIIDLLKTMLKNKLKDRTLFFLDQVLHLAVIAAVIYAYHPYALPFHYLHKPEVILFILFIILVTKVSAIIMKTIISNWKIEDNENSLENAGAYIGVLERILVFVFIISDHWEGIGFLLAAKSVFRYGDLSKTNDRKLTEYILIGTLISFGLAMLIGILYNFVLQNLHCFI